MPIVFVLLFLLLYFVFHFSPSTEEPFSASALATREILRTLLIAASWSNSAPGLCCYSSRLPIISAIAATDTAPNPVQYHHLPGHHQPTTTRNKPESYHHRLTKIKNYNHGKRRVRRKSAASAHLFFLNQHQS